MKRHQPRGDGQPIQRIDEPRQQHRKEDIKQRVNPQSIRTDIYHIGANDDRSDIPPEYRAQKLNLPVQPVQFDSAEVTHRRIDRCGALNRPRSMKFPDDEQQTEHQRAGADPGNEIVKRNHHPPENEDQNDGGDGLDQVATDDPSPEPFDTAAGRRDQPLALLLRGRGLVRRSPLATQIVQIHGTVSSWQWVSSKWRRTRCNRVRYAPSEIPTTSAASEFDRPSRCRSNTARSPSESEVRNRSSTRFTSPSLPRSPGNSATLAADCVSLSDRVAALRRHASAVFSATR